LSTEYSADFALPSLYSSSNITMSALNNGPFTKCAGIWSPISAGYINGYPSKSVSSMVAVHSMCATCAGFLSGFPSFSAVGYFIALISTVVLTVLPFCTYCTFTPAKRFCESSSNGTFMVFAIFSRNGLYGFSVAIVTVGIWN